LSHGSTGSRLLSGAYPFLDEVEQYVARFHQAPAALIFSSGYMANLALMSAIPARGIWYSMINLSMLLCAMDCV